MQKPRRAPGLCNAHELTGWIQQPNQSGMPHPESGLSVLRPELASVTGAPDALPRQHDARQVRQHVGQRDDRGSGALRIALGGIEIDRLIDGKRGRADAAKRREMRAQAEPFAEVVRERAYVKTGGAVHAERHGVCLDADDLEAMGRDAYRGG